MTESTNTQTTGEEQVDATETEAAEETVEEAEEAEPSLPEKKEETIDYKALAKAETARANAAEKAAADNAFKLREEKRGKQEEVQEDGSGDKPLTRTELDSILKEHSQTTQKSSEDAEARRIIAEFTQGTDEADAVYAFWKNRVIPTGDIREDVLFALGGMNVKRTQAQIDELKRANNSKATVNTDGAGTHRDPSKPQKPKTTSQDANALKKSGMKWNGEKRRYEKKLKNGEIFYYDPKENKRGKEKAT